jgi:hypothetical protein
VLARAGYREGVTFLIFYAALAAPIAAIVGYLAWRDRRRQGSLEDPSVSRDALRQADRHRLAVQAYQTNSHWLPWTPLLASSSADSKRRRSG